MIAVTYTGAGGPEVVTVGERPDPVPGDHEVLVRATHAGLNPADLAQRAGHYPAPAGSPQDIPGLEVSGRVVACGAAV
ncbi:MAG TPA: alcohol dehydrogenase catalytic domain-containing protein, partial [Gaiellales bacterium]|nr:alcohol dehydrogenase catalytic domain-containing protein [Gaiellales bacterium]